MTPRSFSIEEAIGFGWRTTLQHILFFIVLLIVAGLAEGIPAVLARVVAGSSPELAFVLQLIQTIIGIIVGIGLLKIALRFVDNQSADLSDLFTSATVPMFFNYLVASILYGLIVVIGLVFFIIPGIYLAARFAFTLYLVVDQSAGPIDALRRSWALTGGQVLKLILLGILSVLIYLAGLIVLLVGLFVAYPTIILAWARVYRRLQSPVPSPA